MSTSNRRFASDDQLRRWRQFSLLKGWNLQGYPELNANERRLFDIPIVVGAIISWFSSPYRLLGVNYIGPVVDPTSGQITDTKRMGIHNGRVYATDSRFIVRSNIRGNTVSIPFRSIIEIKHVPQSYGRSTFFLQIDSDAMLAEQITDQIEAADALDSSEDYLKILHEAALRGVGGVSFSFKYPEADLLNFAAVAFAKDAREVEWQTKIALERTAKGKAFTADFFNFLFEIADQNRRNQETNSIRRTVGIQIGLGPKEEDNDYEDILTSFENDPVVAKPTALQQQQAAEEVMKKYLDDMFGKDEVIEANTEEDTDEDFDIDEYLQSSDSGNGISTFETYELLNKLEYETDDDVRAACVDNLAVKDPKGLKEVQDTFNALNGLIDDSSPLVRAAACKALIRCVIQHLEYGNSLFEQAKLQAFSRIEPLKYDSSMLVRQAAEFAPRQLQMNLSFLNLFKSDN